MRYRWFNAKKQSIFSTWLKSYMLILMVPILITTFAYYQAVVIIEKEVNKVHATSLKQLKQVVDSRIRDVENLAIQLGWNEMSKEVMYIQESSIESYHRYMISSLMKEYNLYKTAFNSIDDFYVYYRNGNFILTRTGKYTTEEYYRIFLQNDTVPYEKWLSILRDKHDKDFIPFINKFGRKSEEKSIVYMQSLPVITTQPPIATIAINLNEESLAKEIANTKWMAEGAVFIIDSENRILASTNSGAYSDLVSYDKLGKSEEVFNQTFNGEKVVVSYAKSDVNSWKYVSVLPTRVFLGNAQYIRKVIYISVLACFLIGITVSYVLTKRNINPLQKIAMIFKGKPGKDGWSNKIGYDFIEDSIHDLIHENEAIHTRLSQQNKYMRDNFLQRLLKGQVKGNEMIRDTFELYDIMLSGCTFMVMLFYIEDVSSTSFKIRVDELRESLDNSLESLFKVVESLSTGIAGAVTTEVDGLLCCILNMDEEDAGSARNKASDIAEQAILYAEKENGIFMTVGISNSYNELEGTAKAYQEAIETIEHKRLLGGRKVMFYEDTRGKDDGPQSKHYGIEDELAFINCIKGENYKEAGVVLERIFNQYFYIASETTNMVKCRMFGLINIMLNAVKECSITCGKEFLEKLRCEERLLSCKTVKDLHNQMKDILQEIDTYSRAKRMGNELSLKNEIIVYIDQCFSDAGLSGSMIAERFDLNQAYLSRFFKKQTGWGLLEYIHKTRIEKAKELLVQQSLSIKEVSEKVGFYNSVAFIRVFKKYEGVTPGKYVEMAKTKAFRSVE